MLQHSYLHIGDILGTHGLKGALTVYSHTRPASAVAGYSCWWIGKTAESATSYPVQRCWQHGKRTLVELEGISDCNQAGQLKGLKIWIPTTEVETEDDAFLWQDLIGCAVIRHGSGACLGTVKALEEYGAQDNLLVQTPADADIQGEWLIPFTEQIVLGVDLDEGLIEVDLPEGMDACFTPRF